MGDDPVFVQAGHIMATTFHPELNKDDAFHRYFLTL
jgi:glutamine amidotransferase PdxT